MLDIRTVLCPVDFTPLADRGLALARRICERFGSRLVLEHNLDAGPPSYLTVSWMWSEEHRGTEDHREEEAKGRLEELLGTMPREMPREARLTRGPVDRALLYLAAELPADLIVMGTHGWSSAEHRSLTEQVIVASPCPVLTTTEECAEAGLCRTGGPEEMTVVVPVDFSERSRDALAYAAALAERLPVRLQLIHVAGTASAAELQALDRRLADQIPQPLAGRTDRRVVSGTPARELASFSREVTADLIVMGVRRKSWLQRLSSGTTAFDMLHDPTCPVWFVPAGSSQRHREPTGAAVAAQET